MSGGRLNYYWRLFATGLAFLFFGIGGLIIPLIAAPVISLSSASAEERQYKARKLIQMTFRLFIHFMRGVGILSWQVRGLDGLQGGGQLVLANHPTLLDVVFLVAFVPQADCIVKGRLRSNPAMRGFIGLTGFMGNDSGAALIEGARRSLSLGSPLIIFPEGTRTEPGEGMKFQRGAANVALRTQAPVTPIYIRCDPITLSKSHKWYHIPSQRFHMQFTVGSPIDVTPYFDQPPSRAARKLTRDLEQLFTQELSTHEQRIERGIGVGVETAHYSNTRSGGCHAGRYSG